MYRRQAAEADGLAVGCDPCGQFVARLEALNSCRQLGVVGLQHQGLEGFERAGAVVPGIQVNGPACHAQLFPALDLAGIDLGQLSRAQLGQGVVGMDDHRHAIQADDLFGTDRAQVAQRLELAQLGVADGPRGRRQVRVATAEGDEAGA
ncbi:hypothetical protein D3C76_1114600 [compost metagenome]